MKLTLTEVDERLGDAERDELLVVRQRLGQPLDHVLVEGERERERRDDRDERR